MKINISAVILTKNEEKNIERAIKSVKFCDEIVVVDDFSSDDTVKKARKLGANIFQRRLKDDFAAQRNFATEKVKGEWVLFVDADEEISSELRNEILKLVQDDKGSTVAYYIKRRDFWWGRELRHGETKKIRQRGLIRLVRKNSGYWEGKVHEEYKIKSQKLKVKSLKNFLNHYPHPTVKEFIKEINLYSTLRAKELFEHGKNTNIFEIFLYPLGKFLLTYFIKLGFLDGPGGFVYAFFMSFHSFLVRAKLYQYRLFSHSALDAESI
ncbi:hypothetical protein A3F58_01770 [Candidatus Roizmanbacteria bacterium RIFCSPHIGHO2_12_FULL_37_9b]|uniref:Glycosyltransferase 2-like domain-containing protein n=1 Tax=Candidatus Roizmanbacteria bacterium RIFCSPHIGHO2_02_FULL_38_11 TaxID=1802039 RepID=A0A1F7H1J1_9BACT|nr:MAG: hypothetical protein A3C25_01315 [Candidatus Roizmanbacteria bacterium RIFCSPHIGHO2_02_FULL_38_11]OGK34617.1 MAG: hypothetical protein A3F58_01770 [Candidatus Roizmanbacteria bacterium RIFCSPHIGHO2_12_FULL_37_9b]